MNTTPKIRPILFSTPMVLANLYGRKSMTRRTRGLDKINQDPGAWYFQSLVLHATGRYTFAPTGNYNPAESDIIQVKCPYGKPGDYLWVREAWCLTQPRNPETYHFGYKSGILPVSDYPASEKYDFHTPDIWHPSIHMPKEAARLFLQVEDVRLERLHDITEGDACAEGADLDISNTIEQKNVLLMAASYRTAFTSLWISINGKQNWDLNPWLWVISYKIISKTGCPDFLKPYFITPSK